MSTDKISDMTARMEETDPQEGPGVKKYESDVRPKALPDDIGHVSLEEIARRAMEAAGQHELGWDRDELTTGVDSPFAKKIQTESQRLSSLGLSRISASDYRIWEEIRGGKIERFPEVTQLSPEAAMALVSYFDGQTLNLPLLKNLPFEVAKMLAMWEGEELLLPGVEMADPKSFVPLMESRIQKIVIGGNRLK